jgi:hypothetical protein
MNKHNPTGKNKRPSYARPADPHSDWLRKSAVASRYNVSERTVDRKVKKKLLPPPEFPLGGELPLWRRRQLDAHDEAATQAAGA